MIPLNVRRNFLFYTYFRTNWPTPRVL